MVSLTRQSLACIFSSGDFSFVFRFRLKSGFRSDNCSNNKSVADLLWPIIIIIIIIAVIVIVIGYCVVGDDAVGVVVVAGWEGF